MQQGTDFGLEQAKLNGVEARSPKWPEAERKHREMEPTCVACGSADNLNVHHILPFHFCVLLGRPELELDQRNLITLCVNHHLLLGHLDDWQSYHKEVREDASGPAGRFYNLLAEVIRENAIWLALEKSRPPVWEKMTDQEKADFRQLMDMMYPIEAQQPS